MLPPPPLWPSCGGVRALPQPPHPFPVSQGPQFFEPNIWRRRRFFPMLGATVGGGKRGRDRSLGTRRGPAPGAPPGPGTRCASAPDRRRPLCRRIPPPPARACPSPQGGWGWACLGCGRATKGNPPTVALGRMFKLARRSVPLWWQAWLAMKPVTRRRRRAVTPQKRCGSDQRMAGMPPYHPGWAFDYWGREKFF